MQLDRLLLDATGALEGSSKRSQYAMLAEALNADGDEKITAKGVGKWFARGLIPSRWLMRVAALAEKRKGATLNEYA